MVARQLGAATPFPGKFFHRQTGTGEQCSPLQEFFDSLHTQGRYKATPHKLTVYHGVDHGVGLGKGLACEGWLDEAVRFWTSQQS